MEGIKHIIECHCVLPQYRQSKQIVYHKFVVFSIIDESGTPIEKHAKCNNCGVIHNVIDICKSEICTGLENGAVMEKEDISLLLPKSVCNILESYDCDTPTYEQTLFVLQNEKYDTHIILQRKEENFNISGKLLKIHKRGKYTIEPYAYKETI